MSNPFDEPWQRGSAPGLVPVEFVSCTRQFRAIRSYLPTAAKHGLSFFDAFVMLADDRPRSTACARVITRQSQARGQLPNDESERAGIESGYARSRGARSNGSG